MLSAIGRISSGSGVGNAAAPILSTVRKRHFAGLVQAKCRAASATRAAADRRVPPQSGQTSSLRNFSTRFIPFSSFTLASAFSTV